MSSLCTLVENSFFRALMHTTRIFENYQQFLVALIIMNFDHAQLDLMKINLKKESNKNRTKVIKKLYIDMNKTIQLRGSKMCYLFTNEQLLIACHVVFFLNQFLKGQWLKKSLKCDVFCCKTPLQK